MSAIARHRRRAEISHDWLATAGRLIESVVAIGGEYDEMADQRRAFLTVLADLVGADSGFWSWGRGRPDSNAVTPVAIIDFGFSDKQRALVIEWGLDEHVDAEFRQPITARLGFSKRSTDYRRQLFADETWEDSHMRRQMAKAGWESWLHSVRYSNIDTWSNLFLLRKFGQLEFGPDEAAIVDLAMSSVAWLHSTADELLPPETFVGLTPRQRTVMLMLLDGLPRKSIAGQLGIAEDTVGDHIKSIYLHFGVKSAGELAALFLRSK